MQGPSCLFRLGLWGYSVASLLRASCYALAFSVPTLPHASCFIIAFSVALNTPLAGQTNKPSCFNKMNYIVLQGPSCLFRLGLLGCSVASLPQASCCALAFSVASLHRASCFAIAFSVTSLPQPDRQTNRPVLIIKTSLARPLQPLQANPAGLLGRFAPTDFMLAFSVASLPQA